jgi:hypothetical protein
MQKAQGVCFVSIFYNLVQAGCRVKGKGNRLLNYKGFQKA